MSAYTGSGEGATSRKSTLNSCFSLGTVQKVALLLPGTWTSSSIVAIVVLWREATTGACCEGPQGLAAGQRGECGDDIV